ncbi:MAG: adenylyl-sulfate kinase, partial [Minisyncoccia bacterium]
MIITFTGQPNSGKTTLSQQLTEYLKLKGHTVNWIDGDNLREMVKNFDYSERGRKRNIETAYSIAKLYNRTTNYIVVSLVSPFKDLRESLK